MARPSRLVAVLALSATVTLALPAVADAAEPGAYVVKDGDTLIGIATKVGVRLADLLRVNDLTVTSVIHPGQRLDVPGAGGGSSAASGGRAYTVRAGDTLIGIARRHNVTLTALLDTNDLAVTSMIHPGQRLTIPGGSANGSTDRSGATPSGRTYTVRAGDTLGGIARHHSVTLAALLDVNDLSVTSMIHPGAKLSLPAGARVSAIDRVVGYALAQLGKPYKFFTRGPSTFDCSGLTLAAYAQIGIPLIHHSASQARQGTAVDFWREAIRPGDLVFLSTDGDDIINHVGIAISATTWIQARRPGDVVRVSPLPRDSAIMAVRRYVNG